MSDRIEKELDRKHRSKEGEKSKISWGEGKKRSAEDNDPHRRGKAAVLF